MGSLSIWHWAIVAIISGGGLLIAGIICAIAIPMVKTRDAKAAQAKAIAEARRRA